MFLGLDAAEDDLGVIGYKDDLVFPRVNGFYFLSWLQGRVDLFQNHPIITICSILPLLENKQISSGIQNKVVYLLNYELADLEHARKLQKVVKTTIFDEFVINIRVEIEYKYCGI